MQVERFHRGWRAHERAVPIHPAMSLEPEGLVLGAGTVLVPACAKRRLGDLQGREARVLVLLSVAYEKPVAPTVLGHIERAARCWADGEDCLAQIHLALAGLHQPEDRREAARRLFVADTLMKAGVAARTILEALDLDTSGLDALEKFDQGQLRVPKGSGDTSGEWTVNSSVLADLGTAAALFIGNLVRDNAVTFALGLLLIPDDNNIHVEGEVPELPGLRYAWNRDEELLRLTYAGPNGPRDIQAMVDADGLFHDGDKVVARLMPDNTLVIDPGAVSDDLADRDGPDLCPATTKDKPGGNGEQGEKARDYEDQIKRLVNPNSPTPRGYAYKLPDPVTGGWVNVDDCQHSTGAIFEMKSGYDGVVAFPEGRESLTKDWLDQSRKYVEVSRGFPIFWVFAKQGPADFAQELFKSKKEGREKIIVGVVPRTGVQ